MTLSIKEYDKVVWRFAKILWSFRANSSIWEYEFLELWHIWWNCWRLWLRVRGGSIMNSKAVYTTPVNRIKQRILFDDNLDNLSTLCPTWEDFVIEVSEWGIYELGGVDFDTLTSNDIERLNQFQKNQSSEEAF